MSTGFVPRVWEGIHEAEVNSPRLSLRGGVSAISVSRGEDGEHGKGDFRAAVFAPTWDNSSSPQIRNSSY